MDLSSPSHPVLSGLLRKRQEITAEIRSHETALQGLVTSVDALDAAIRLFAPELDMEAVKVRPTPRRGGAKLGDNATLILDLLRTEGPQTSRQCIKAVMRHREMSTADRRLYAVMRNRVMASLRGMEKRGSLERLPTEAGAQCWLFLTQHD